MNRKIEAVKKKRADKALERELADKQVKAQKELVKSIDGLYELLDGQEKYDFDKLYKQLVGIDKRLDLAPYFSSLEKSFNTKIQSVKLTNPFLKTKIDGFSELHRIVKDIESKIKAQTSPDEYRPCDQSYESGQNFFGFMHSTGKWYIMRQSGSNGNMLRYASGSKNYIGSWAKRASLDYKYPNEIQL